MSKVEWHSKVIYILVSLVFLLSLGITAIPLASPVAAQSADYEASEIEDWLISQIESTEISLSTAPTVNLDASANTMTINAGITARGTTLELNNVKFTFDGTTEVSITGELSILGKKPRFSCQAEMECNVADKIPQLSSISNLKLGGFEPSLSQDTLDKIADTINEVIQTSGLKLESLGGDLTGIGVSNTGTPKLELKWSDGSVKLNADTIQGDLNDAANNLVNQANDYLNNGYDKGKWSVDVSIGGGKLTLRAEATALGIMAKIENMDATFSGTTAFISDVLSLGSKRVTFSATASITCTNYVPSVTVMSLGIGNEYPKLKNWIEGAATNSALRDALNRLATNIIDDTGLKYRIYRFNNIAVTDNILRVWYEAPPAPPGPPLPPTLIVANLSISPTTVSPGEKLTISATVSNVGAQGTYVVELKVNGVVEATQSVTLSQNQSTTVSFTVSKDQPGTYQVELDGLKGSFTVKEGVVPPPSWISRYWWTIVAGIAGIVLLGLLVYFLRRRTTG